MDKKKPKFNVPNSTKKKRVKSRWRKPRGIDNKKRIGVKEFGPSPRVGYGTKKSQKGAHPLGLMEVRVFNVKELEEFAKVNGSVNLTSTFAVRIAGKVSKKNKELIRKKAKELGVRTLN